MKIFFIIKNKSERVKNKNFIKFEKIELYKKVLYRFKKFKVFVDTDSSRIIKESKKDKNLSHCHVYQREKKFIDMENSSTTSPTPLMIKFFLENFIKNEKEIVVTSHVTSPFLTIKTLNKAILKMKDFDSVSSCIEQQQFSYLKKNKFFSPINFNNKIIQKTQSLPSILHLIGAFFIIKKNIFLNNGLQRISKKNYFYPLDFPENLDIDDYSDLDIALRFNKVRKFF
jgi:CMP-N-acetylneuraminic acid synthetase|tara:strand:+ start:1523 stop:2203 length:681 start_codon:yes stop_codon:yes gene_type:complete